MSYELEMTKKTPRVVFVSGLSNGGKTTLIELLIPRLRKLGLRVGTIKHAHEGYEVDRPGKDSWRHTQAGATAVTLISPKQVASFVGTSQEMQLTQVIEQMAPHVDLILAEGFKQVNGPKILIEPNASYRVQIDHPMCRIGAFPTQLSPVEIEEIAQFCGGK